MKNHIRYAGSTFLLAATTSLCAIAQVANAGNDQSQRLEKMNRLLEAASIASPSIPVPDEIQNSKDSAKRRQYFEQRSRKFQQVEAEHERARDELAAMGEDIIDPLLEIHRSGRFGSSIVRVLRKIGTPKARAALLQIALGQNGPGRPDALAARYYIELAEDREDTGRLLVSRDADVLDIALKNLPGVKLDAELLKRLDELLPSSKYHPVMNYVLRTRAARVMATDAGNMPMREKISALVKSLDTVEQMPKSNERFQYDQIGTFADRTYLGLASSLEKVPGADKYLSEATDRRTGNPRRWLLAIRANRGDSPIRSQIRGVLEYPEMLERTTLRLYALRAYGKIGTPEDIAFLRTIAESDPVVMLDRGGPLLETINSKPINNAGERAVIYDESTVPEWERLGPGQRTHIIRREAQQAIRAIQGMIPMDGEQHPPSERE